MTNNQKLQVQGLQLDGHSITFTGNRKHGNRGPELISCLIKYMSVLLAGLNIDTVLQLQPLFMFRKGHCVPLTELE